MTIKFECDEFVFEPEAFRIVFEKKELKLSHKESAVFRALCENSMCVVERKYLLSSIWNDSESCDISLNKSILMLRRKLESMGTVNVIDTIPRVGYLLKLKMDVREDESLEINYVEPISEGSLETNEVHSEPASSLYRKFSVYGIVISLFVILYANTKAFKLSRDEEPNDNPPAIQSLSNDETTDQVFLYTSDVKNIGSSAAVLDSYRRFQKKIKSDKKSYALMSKNALSYLSEGGENSVLWQNIFLIDQRENIQSQLDCIAGFINTPTSAGSRGRLGSWPSSGLRVTYFSFYQGCHLPNGARYIGDLLIKATPPLDASKYDATWIVDFTFLNHSGDELFQIKRISRAHQNSNKQWSRHVSVKSIIAEHLEQEKLQLDPIARSIFEEFTQDDAYHMIIDEINKIYASSAFGGIIYHVETNPIHKQPPGI